MICPQCSSPDVEAWPWQDGGYKGVRCDDCETEWWSESFQTAAHAAEAEAMRAVLKRTPFPVDAVTDEERQREWSAAPEPGKSDE